MSEPINGHGQFAFDDSPPKAGPELFIKRLDKDETVLAVVASKKLRGIWIHWNGKRGRSEPHFRDEKQCPGCKAGMPKRWKGFLHCVVAPKGEEMFVELTPETANQLAFTLGKDSSWRGNRIQLVRGKSKASRINVSVLTKAPDNYPIPPERDPSESVLKLWGYSLGEDGHWHEDRPADAFGAG